MKTEHKIVKLIPEGNLSGETALVLVNAIYFKGSWEFPFEKELTEEAPFHLSAKEKINVPMMWQQNKLNFSQGEGMKILELPYQGHSLSMFFVLPDGYDLGSVEKALGSGKLKDWITKMKIHSAHVTLPRYKIIKDCRLKEFLEAMGMIQAFKQEADFSGIVPPPTPFFINQVFHKTFLELNEQGTEAAAATAVEMPVPTSLGTFPPPAKFFANRPFLFLIAHKGSGAILFLGRLANPLKE